MPRRRSTCKIRDKILLQKPVLIRLPSFSFIPYILALSLPKQPRRFVLHLPESV